MKTERGKWAALAVLAAEQFIVILDGAVVNVALPSIQRDLHFSASSIQWVFSAYLLTYGGLLLLGGRVADIVGRRVMFMAGAAVLNAASLAAGLASSAGQLLERRWESVPRHLTPDQAVIAVVDAASLADTDPG